jgi:hypothetical protein
MQDLGAGAPCNSSLNSSNDQPFQHLSKSGMHDARTAFQSKGIVGTNKPRQSPITSTDNTISQAMCQVLPELILQTPLLTSKFSSPDLSHSSATSNLAGTGTTHVPHLYAKNTINAKASALLANSLSASNLEYIRVASDHQPPAPAVTGRQYKLPPPSPPQFRPDNNHATTLQASAILAQVSHTSYHQYPKSIRDLSSPSHRMGILETSRIASNKKSLRDKAAKLVSSSIKTYVIY